MRSFPWFSRSAASYIKRCIFSNFFRLLKGDISFPLYLRSLLAGISFPLVKLKILRDPFELCLQRILNLEEAAGVRSSFYFIPFKGEPGHKEKGVPAPAHRGARYDIEEYRGILDTIEVEGWETGIHGLDAHTGVAGAKRELERFRALLPDVEKVGMRMHWLFQPPALWANLREAGFYYDATFGSNDVAGFIDGHYEPFRKDGLWVLPLTIQDGTLLADWRRHMSTAGAWKEIEKILDTAKEHQAVVTVLWHNVSFGAPRYWGGLYEKIIARGKQDNAHFLTARQVIDMFDQDQEQEEE